MASESNSLTDLVDELEQSADDDGSTTIKDILKASGSRSMGPALFVPALVAFSPIGAIPGVGLAMGVVVILFAAQIVFGRNHLWVPDLLGDRELPSEKVKKGARKMRAVTRRLDGVLGGRWTWATGKTGSIAVGIIACVLGAAMGPVAIIPFALYLPSGGLLLISAGLVTRDGVLVVLGCATAAGTLAWAYMHYLGGGAPGA